MTKQLHGMTAAQEMTVKCQALPVPGESSELREKVLQGTIAFQRKGEACCRETRHTRSQTCHLNPPRLTKIGRGEALKLHFKRTPQGEGWSVEMGDSGPSVGHLSQTPLEKSQPQESKETV